LPARALEIAVPSMTGTRQNPRRRTELPFGCGTTAAQVGEELSQNGGSVRDLHPYSGRGTRAAL